MLLQCTHERPDAAAQIVETLAHGISAADGGWGYGTTIRDFGLQADLVNLSTSQFGALGLWAGGRASGVTAEDAWEVHLRALCRDQAADGSWPYARPRAPARVGYPTGTCMGLADLVLARRALDATLEDDPDLTARTEMAFERGRAALDRDAGGALDPSRKVRGFDFYQLYAIEKACVFVDTERVGGVAWYVAGATLLLDAQNRNGSWGSTRPVQGIGLVPPRPTGDVVSTSFALLFLLRVSETFHPTTPHDVVSAGPTTPGGADAPAAPAGGGPQVPPPPRAVSMSRATEALDRVTAWLHAQKADDAGAFAALDDVAAALRHLEADPVAETASPGTQMAREREFMERSRAWREHAGTVLVDCVEGRSDRIALRAALALSAGPLSASLPLRSAIDRRLRSGHPEEAPRPLVDASFAALADLGHGDLLPWLATRVTATRAVLDVRAARAALAALAHFDGGERADRLAAARRIVRAVSGLADDAAAAKPDELPGRTAVVHWRTLGPPAVAALRALCADDAGDPPLGADGRPLATVADFAAYLDVKRAK